VNGGVRSNEFMKDENNKHPTGKIWYESVTEPVFESPENLHIIKDGQLPDELPTSKYFTGRKYAHRYKAAKTRGMARHLSHLSKENHHLQSAHTPAVPASPEKWLKENGYKLSDFGLSDGNTDPDDMAVFSESPNELESLDRSYINSVLSSLSLKGSQASSLNHNNKAKPTTRTKNTKKLLSGKQHSKKGDLVANPHYQRIMKLVSLLKDYSKTRTQEESMAKDVLLSHHPSHKHLRLQHHTVEPITSSERVAEDETANSDTEAKATSQAMQFLTSTKLNSDFHKSISSTPTDFTNAHHLVTVDTTTGEVFDERNLPQQHSLEPTDISGLMKKTSMGYIPQHVKVEKGKRRASVSSTRKNSTRSNTRKLLKNTRKSLSRSLLLKKITENLYFVDTEQLRKLESTLEKIRHSKKNLH